MSLKRVTKKHVEELKQLILNHGYWSKEVYDFNNKFEHHSMKKLNEKVRYELRFGN